MPVCRTYGENRWPFVVAVDFPKPQMASVIAALNSNMEIEGALERRAWNRNTVQGSYEREPTRPMWLLLRSIPARRLWVDHELAGCDRL